MRTSEFALASRVKAIRHPRGRRPGGAPLRGRPRSRAGAGRGARRAARRLAEPPRPLAPPGLPVRRRSRASSAPTAPACIAGTDERVVINPASHATARRSRPRRAPRRHARRADRGAAERTSIRSPTGLTFEQAAAFPLVFETAYRMLVTKARLAAGRVGADLGHRRRRRDGGARDRAARSARRTIVTSSSDEKLEQARELGADETRRTTTSTTSPARVKELTGGGADVVVEHVGDGDLGALARRRPPRGTDRRLRGDDRAEPAGGAAPDLVEASSPSSARRWARPRTSSGAYDLIALGPRAAGASTRSSRWPRRAAAHERLEAASSSARSCCGSRRLATRG